MRREIRSLQQHLGITIIYVTHDQIEAMTMADKIGLLNAGRVEQIATREELYARPATRFTAKFIGTPPMDLHSPEDADVADWFRTHLAAGFPASAPLALTLGVRPEGMRLAETGVPAEVFALEYLGGGHPHRLPDRRRRLHRPTERQGQPRRGRPGPRGLARRRDTHFFLTKSGRRWEP